MSVHRGGGVYPDPSSRWLNPNARGATSCSRMWAERHFWRDRCALRCRRVRLSGVTFDPGGPPARLTALSLVADPRIMAIPVPNAAEGMSASLARGAVAADTLGGDAAPGGIMVLPADMPEIDAEDLKKLCAAFETAPDQIVRAVSSDGTPGHPVIFPRRCFAALAVLTGDAGARSVLEGEEVTLVPLAGNHATLDLDTPEDWAAWGGGARSSQG